MIKLLGRNESKSLTSIANDIEIVKYIFRQYLYCDKNIEEHGCVVITISNSGTDRVSFIVSGSPEDEEKLAKEYKGK